MLGKTVQVPMTFRLAAALLAGVLATAGCGLVTDSERDTILGSGLIVTRVREVDTFDRIEFASEGRVIVSPGAQTSLAISADDNLHEYLDTSVRGTTLWIRTRDGADIDPSDSMVFRIGVPDLQSVEVTGVANVEIPALRRDSFSIELSGVGNIEVENLQTDRLEVSASGTGDIRLNGSAATALVEISGPAGYHADVLETRETSISLSGAGTATVWATERLTASVSGAGTVRYYGNPELESSITGIGDIEQLAR